MARLGDTRSLGYCTNVHPGESWPEVLSNLRTHAPRVRQLWGRSSELALGVWLSAQAAKELLAPGEIRRLQDFCAEAGVSIPSINGFPIGGFHEAEVKRGAYRPDWTTDARLGYSLDLIRVAAELARPDEEISISTLPISYRDWIRSPDDLEQATARIGQAVVALARAELERGARVHLALEPEPDCWLETSRDVAKFFVEHLWPSAAPSLRRELGVTEARAMDLLRDKVRVCYDTCHAAIAFESPHEVLDAYDHHGIQVGKVQLSSAPRVHCVDGRTAGGADIVSLLEPFSRDRYLHQVIGRAPDGSIARYPDLPDALAHWRSAPPTGEFRVHCHVPLFLARYGELETTQDHVTSLLDLAERRHISAHWEVETYTWEVLPEPLREGELAARIARELEWI